VTKDEKIKELRKLLKETMFQFEGLIQQLSEDDYLDSDVEALLVALLEDIRKELKE